jgi:hypothetical protein
VALFVDTSTFDLLYPECSFDDHGQRPLLVVSRGSTRSEKMQIADLPSGTMRRISRARSINSGVELWHPAKPLLENRVVFVHCIIMTSCIFSALKNFAKNLIFIFLNYLPLYFKSKLWCSG